MTLIIHLSLGFISGLERVREALEEFSEPSNGAESNSVKDGGCDRAAATKEDGADLDNGAIVNSTSSPESKSSDQLTGKDSPVVDEGVLAPEDFVLLDCQASKPAEGLDSLIGTLRHQIRSSDWLEKNTPELSAGEDPEILDVFKALLERARK